MKELLRGKIAGILALGLLALLVLVFAAAAQLRQPTVRPSAPPPEEPAAPSNGVARAAEPPERAHIEVIDHELQRVQHKDAAGRLPLELVNTPQGTVTIQQTFSDDGVLLKEEAFLEGKPAPVPRP